MKLKFFSLSLGIFSFAILVFVSDAQAMSRKTVRLDSATKACMMCHKMDTGKHFGPSHTAHLVGMDYVSVAELDPTLVTAGRLDPRIKLVDGRISCITCHREYDAESHRVSDEDRNNADAPMYPFLRVDNRGSGLCLKCHKK